MERNFWWCIMRNCRRHWCPRYDPSLPSSIPVSVKIVFFVLSATKTATSSAQVRDGPPLTPSPQIWNGWLMVTSLLWTRHSEPATILACHRSIFQDDKPRRSRLAQVSMLLPCPGNILIHLFPHILRSKIMPYDAVLHWCVMRSSCFNGGLLRGTKFNTVDIMWWLRLHTWNSKTSLVRGKILSPSYFGRKVECLITYFNYKSTRGLLNNRCNCLWTKLTCTADDSDMSTTITTL